MELGIVECKGLLSMRTADGKGCTDAYAVANYGPSLIATVGTEQTHTREEAWNTGHTRS